MVCRFIWEIRYFNGKQRKQGESRRKGIVFVYHFFEGNIFAYHAGLHVSVCGLDKFLVLSPEKKHGEK